MARLDQLIFQARQGRMRNWFLFLATAILLVGVGSYLCLKREAGPATERIIEKGVVARELAQGNGHTTRVRTPYQVSRLASPADFDPSEGMPELWQAPASSWYLAGAFKLIGESGRNWLFKDPEVSPNRDFPFFRADRFWLFSHFVLLLFSAGLIFWVGNRLWNPAVAWVGTGAWLLSLTTWQELIALNESHLAILLILLSLVSVLWLRKEALKTPQLIAAAVLMGLSLGLLFLTRYAFLLFALPLLIMWAYGLRGSEKAKLKILIPVVAFVVVISPWMIRNASLSSNPFGFAAETVSVRVGDPTAEFSLLKDQFNPDGLEFSIRKVLHKGLASWEYLLLENFWKGGGLLFSALFLISLLYPFKNAMALFIRRTFFIPVLFFLFFEPFFATGAIQTPGLFYFSPLCVLFGAAFLFVLLNSLSFKQTYTRPGLIILLLCIQALPMIRFGAEPKRLPFHYPPYWPSVFVDVERFHEETYGSRSAVVADIPAGFSWYSGAMVWAQPEAFEDFSEIFLYEDVCIQFFSPDLLDRPFLSELKLQGKANYEGEYAHRNWGEVYTGIVEGELPRFYPLRGLQVLHHNVYVAYRTR